MTFVQTSQLKAAVAARALWQPDFFSRIERGPMRALWRDQDPEEFTRWARKLSRYAGLVVLEGDETDSPLSSDRPVNFYFRCSPSMHVCALCVEEATGADGAPPARRGTPAPALLYIYPTSTDPQTLVRWLIADYLVSQDRQRKKAKKQVEFDPDWIWTCEVTIVQPEPLSAAMAARALWQPDFFSHIKRGPMRTLWRDEDPDEFARWARKLRRNASLVMRGNGENNSPMSSDWALSFYLRCSPSLHVCALCVDDEATTDWEPPARRGAPSPDLLYIYPTSTDPQTLVRWLITDYLASNARQLDEIEEQGDFDLTGIVDDWN